MHEEVSRGGDFSCDVTCPSVSSHIQQSHIHIIHHPTTTTTVTTMSSVAARRLLKEYRQLVDEAPEGISAGPVDEDNLFEWECLIQGPDDTPFEGGLFPATLTFPKVFLLPPLPFPPPILPLKKQAGLPTLPAKNALHVRDVPSKHLQGRHGMHQYLTPAGGRPEPVREREREVESDTERGEDFD